MSKPSQQQRDPTRPVKPWYWRLGERPAQFGYIALIALMFVTAGFVSSGATFGPLFNRADVGHGPPEQPRPTGPAPTLPAIKGLRLPAKVTGEQVGVWRDGAFRPQFWAGVNVGSSVPGQDPGAVAATKGDYDRWFREMGELGISVIRIYTILSPAFYDSLRDYNLSHPKQPLYVLHGIWIPEHEWYRTGNIWDPAVVREMRKEIADAVAAEHGDAQIDFVPGHASGTYRSDISPWMLGWSFGIEWDPTSTMKTNRMNRGRRPKPGTYIRTAPTASPMEQWIGEHLDYLAQQEAARGFSLPLTFTNWDTTDPLHHPSEPLADEDAVSIDAMHLSPTAQWPAGYFASFHAYPYYPDFNRWEPAYLNHRRPRDGVRDPYAGYIHALREHHKGIPLMITEVGQPTSLGCAHYAPLGRHQGCHSEQEAARHLISLIDDVHDEGGAGAMAFMWLDEWFKFTWNTIDYELPHERRSKWRNPLTNEEHFGLIAAEPGPRDLVVLDGQGSEWAAIPPIGNGTGSVRDVRATSDAENVYLQLKVTPELWKHKRIVLGLDAHAAGNKGVPGMPGVDPAADVAVVIGPGKKARIFQAAWNESLGMRYGGFANPKKAFVPAKRADLVPGSGAWVPLRQILNYPYRLPLTGAMRPTEVRDASTMPWGTTDPADPSFDDRNLIDGSGDVLEIAIPWGMMTFSDPSTHKVVEYRLTPEADKQTVAKPIERLGISVAVPGEPLLRTTGYTWDDWDEIVWHERRKAGWPILQKMYRGYGQAGSTR